MFDRRAEDSAAQPSPYAPSRDADMSFPDLTNTKNTTHAFNDGAVLCTQVAYVLKVLSRFETTSRQSFLPGADGREGDGLHPLIQ
jgi:hypothetical protein